MVVPTHCFICKIPWPWTDQWSVGRYLKTSITVSPRTFPLMVSAYMADSCKNQVFSWRLQNGWPGLFKNISVLKTSKQTCLRAVLDERKIRRKGQVDMICDLWLGPRHPPPKKNKSSSKGSYMDNWEHLNMGWLLDDSIRVIINLQSVVIKL